MDTLLARLIDYAGLYPPASLDMRTAVRNYLQYLHGPHRAALGRFIVSLDRLAELRTVAGDSFTEMQLSVILASQNDPSTIAEAVADAIDRTAFECKVSESSEIERMAAHLPHSECYFEIPMGAGNEGLLDAIAARGARAKLRMGGVVSDAFSSTGTVASMLHALGTRRLAFKATAGLHHPVRSRHPLTYEPDSNEGMMHGFLNLMFASAAIYFDRPGSEVLHILEEQDPHAWQLAREEIRCRASLWSADQLGAVRDHFFISFGSCSFEEPIRDLEAMGWL